MAFARLIIDGQDWEFAGDIEDKFLGFSNTLSATRSGKVYAESQPSVKTVSVGDIMADPSEFEVIEDFFKTCGTRKFVVTVVIGEDCDVGNGRARYIYTGAVIDGDSPTINFITKKVSDFSFGYETRTFKSS